MTERREHKTRKPKDTLSSPQTLASPDSLSRSVLFSNSLSRFKILKMHVNAHTNTAAHIASNTVRKIHPIWDMNQ